MATIKSIEEKAKAYDEALKKAKDMLSYKEVRQEDIEYLFPELKESEDEKIKKAILELVRQSSEILEKKNQEQMIAWLEKQGKNNMGISEATKKKLEDNLNKALEKETPESFNKFLDEQGEQKRADKVEPKFKVKYAGCEYNVLEVKDIAGVTFYGIEDEPNHIDYVKADNCEIISGGYGIKENGSPYPTKPAVFSEQKLAWSEEDERIRQDIENLIHFALRDGSAVSPAAATTKEDAISWIQSLKDRILPQPKQEWSGGDEAHLHSLITHLEQWIERHPNTTGADVQGENIAWLKSLRPQNRWKPSDESFNNTSCTCPSKKEAESKVWKQ